ncbi:hypothetical protein Tco_0227383 [Tanacetum coccineum]
MCSSKRDAEEELDQGSYERQNPSENSEPTEESKEKEDDELSQEELQQLMIMVLEEGMNVEALQTKYPITDWDVYTEDSNDLVKLWSLVQERFNSTDPTEDKEIELWVELKRLFEPDVDDELWKSQKHVHDITWRLYDTCGVHHVSTKDGIDIYMLVEKEYPLSRGVLTQMLAAKLLVEQNNEMSRELLRKIFMMAERPRRGGLLGIKSLSTAKGRVSTDKLIKDALEKTLLPFAQSSSPDQFDIKAAESLLEYELKNILYTKMHKSQSHLTHDTNQELYDALTWSMLLDEATIKKGDKPKKVLKKRDHGDDQDEDPSSGSNQGKKTKKRRSNESESSKNTSTTKESSKGKSLARTSKSG